MGSVADPGFPRPERGVSNPQGWIANLLFGHFSRKLHKHERNCTQRENTSLVPPKICKWGWWLYLQMVGTQTTELGQWRIQNFPEGGAPTAKVGAPTYYFCQFPPKPHEIEEIWTERGRAFLAPSPPPLDRPCCLNFLHSEVMGTPNLVLHHFTPFVPLCSLCPWGLGANFGQIHDTSIHGYSQIASYLSETFTT